MLLSDVLSFFFNHDEEWGSYSITKAGTIVLAILILVLMIGAAFLTSRKQRNVRLSAKTLAFAGVGLALSFATSYVKIIPMPYGGSVTLFSMLFICLIGYWYGVKIGFITALAYSVLQFFQDGGSYILDPFQVCCDYFFAFTALGITGFFKGKKYNMLIVGYWIAIIMRGVFHTIGGYIYWMEYMPENFPASLSAIYPIVYNYSYILLEGILTTILLVLPPVKKALRKVQQIATN